METAAASSRSIAGAPLARDATASLAPRLRGARWSAGGGFPVVNGSLAARLQAMRTSYWFIPSVMALAAVLPGT